MLLLCLGYIGSKNPVRARNSGEFGGRVLEERAFPLVSCGLWVGSVFGQSQIYCLVPCKGFADPSLFDSWSFVGSFLGFYVKL
jgi:hypothetical protein